ncbi:mechanosensitive ion channel family protein [Stutzerimonas tarimensis]|uniref:Mechanosensitive ion channel family protein n=1 Tax=Stutzerimonas tarimensis TaxID=1507735 RepID=A0ABV7T062_9GAMM
MNWDVLINQSFWTNLAILVTITLVSYWLLCAAQRIAVRRLRALHERTQGRTYGFAAEMLQGTSRLLVLAFSLMIGLKIVQLAPRWEATLSQAWFLALAFQIALWLDMAVRLWMQSLTLDGKARNPVTTTIVGIMLRILIWVMMLLSILANLGVDITAMVASLGVGGIAIALAVQTLLSDLFASLSIGLDKPFEIGDFVVFGDVAGTIEHIGLKTTRIRSLSGEQIVCSNAALQSQTLHNYKRMGTRRIVFRFGITYDTPTDKVREVSALVKRVIESVGETKFDRAHFMAFDDSQLTFEVVHIVQSSDYNRYMHVQQEINLGLLQGLRDIDVKFALPVRNVEFIGGTLPEISVAGLPKTSANQSTEGRGAPQA